MAEKPFVWDATGLLYASACGHLDWLLDAAGPDKQHLVPDKVHVELSGLGFPLSSSKLKFRALGPQDPEVSGTAEQEARELRELTLLNDWYSRLGVKDGRNAGEAWVATVAEIEGGAAIIDDRKARDVITNMSDVEVHGVLWAISRGVIEGRVPTASAYSGLCDKMLGAQVVGKVGPLRWPIKPGGYRDWFLKHREELK